MGPKEKPVNMSIDPIKKASWFAHKVSVALFNRPAFYLFYGSVAIINVVLLTGGTLPWEVYATTLFLGIILLVGDYKKRKSLEAQIMGKEKPN